MSETNVGNMSETKLAERQRFILSSIKKNPLITGKEMSETLSVTQRTIERDLAAMQKAGIIRHEGKVNARGWCLKSHKRKIDLKSATKPFNVLIACTCPLITELADKLRLKKPLMPTISPYPTMRLEAIRSIIPISCRRYPKSVWNTSA